MSKLAVIFSSLLGVAAWLAATPVVRAQALSDLALWNALSSEGVAESEAAVNALAADPEAALALIERELGPLAGNIDARAAALVADLRHAKYDRRERAQQQLAALGALVEPELRRQLAANLPLEARTRVQQLLNGIPGPFAATAADRRLVRLVQLLERIDEPRARAVLAAVEPARNWAIVDSRIPPLYVQLSSPSPSERAAAAVALLRLGEAAAPILPRLIDMLAEAGPLVPVGQNSRSVADHVTVAFQSMGRSAVAPLIDALHRPEVEVRRRAAMLLGIFRDDRAIEPLVEALTDADRGVSAQAAAAVGRLGSKAFDPLVKLLDHADPWVRSQTVAALAGTLDRRAVSAIAHKLRDDDANVRQWAVQSLRPFRAAALDELIAALTSDEPSIRNDAQLRTQIVGEMVLIDDPRVVEPLIQALDDVQPDIRSQALSFLLIRRRDAFDEPRLVEAVIDGLADPAPNVRIAAANVLARSREQSTALDPQRVATALLAALDDDNDGVRAAAAEAIGAWEFPQAVEPLLRRLDDNAVRVVAAEALGHIGDPRAIEPLRGLLAGQDPRVIRALGELGDRASVPALIELLANGPPPAQSAATIALGKIRDARAVEPLIAALQSPRGDVQNVARALGDIGDPRAVAPLLEVCRRPDALGGAVMGLDRTPDQQAAAWAFVAIGAPAIPALAEALDDNSATTRDVAAWALYNLNSQGEGVDSVDMQPAIQHLADALVDDSTIVRYHAAMTLGALGDRRAASVLQEMIATDAATLSPHNVYMNAATYLGRLKDPATVAPLVGLLADNRPGVRTEALRALGMLRDEQAIEPIVELLDDDAADVRLEAAIALGNLKATDAVERLIPVLADPSAEVRSGVARSLGFIGDTQAASALATLAEDSSLDVRLAASIALVRLDDARGSLAIEQILADESAENREKAAAAIYHATLKDKTLVPQLAKLLDDPAPRVRRYAVEALGNIGGDEVVNLLLARLDDRDNVGSVLLALGATGDERAFPALVALLDHELPRMRAAAIYQMSASEVPNRTALVAERLADQAGEVRLAAIDGLVRLEAVDALPQLERLANDADPKVAARAVRAVKRLSAAPAP